MLIQYSVDNYKSIRDEIVINFSVGKKFLDSDKIIKGESSPTPLYRCIGLMGPNASGKSNIIESIYFAVKFVLNTISRKENAKINVETFAFTEEDRPTSFEFIFYQNAVKYVYGFSITSDVVVDEYLFGYFSSKPKTLFERSEGQNYVFKGNDVKTQNEISKKTNRNRLYMPVAAEWGYAPLKKVYDWFVFYGRQYINFSISNMISEIIKEREQKANFINHLQKADFNIKDIYVKNKNIPQKQYDFMTRLLNETFGENEEFSVPKTESVVRVVHENLLGETFDIPLDEDSDGTDEFVKNITEFVYLSMLGGLMIEDELGRAFHTKLTEHFLNVVQSPEYNTGNAQLLFSTHNTKVLNLLNPDQIYLVDKDEETGVTFVKLLDDFVIRQNDNVELGYLKGRYGGLPSIRG